MLTIPHCHHFISGFLLTGKWVCYNCQNHPINPVRLSESSDFVTHEAISKSEAGNNVMGDDIPLQCDEEMGECTVEVKDIHIQGEENQSG